MKNKIFDDVINTSVINLYTLSKEKQKIILKNFDYKKESHKCVFEIVKIANLIFNFPIEFVMPIHKFYLFKFLFRNKWTDNIARNAEDNGIDVNTFILHIEEAYNEQGIFEKVYREYYGEKNDYLY